MSTAIVPAPSGAVALPPVAVPDEPVWRFTVEQYHEMIRAGILQDGDPVELLEGVLTAKMTKLPPHSFSTLVTRDALLAIVPRGWMVNTQEAITTGDSEPEPDVIVVRGSPRDYVDHHPVPQDLALLVEVADTTLRRDRGRKKRLYARAGVREYWIVNLIDRQIEVYTDPTGPADEPDYRQRRDYLPADAVPVTVDGREVGRLTVADLLP